DAEGNALRGWRLSPIPVDPGNRRFRRFRHPDGWVMLTDADDPEALFAIPHHDAHLVLDDRGGVVHAVVVPPGASPGSGDAYSLSKAAAGPNRYEIAPAWPVSFVSEVLSLWSQVFLDTEEIRYSHHPADRPPPAEEPEPMEPVDTDPLGHDEELAAILGDYDDIFWFQADLTWPDRDDAEAFRDRVDVRVRDEGFDTWLLSIEPMDGGPGSRRTLADGGVVVLDPDDPSSIRLEHDRMVLAVSVQQTGFEPAGVAVPLGEAPGTDQWEELRRVQGEHEGSIVIHAPAWSEQRVSLALTEWALAWTGPEPRFIYDFDDPVSQAAIEANNRLENAAPAARSVRTATRQVCSHTAEAQVPFEEPLPCGRPATAYYLRDDTPVLVCDEHEPPGVKTTTLLRA
ncbi:MAG: hypothetical protein R3246_08740, partial [Acidimicrobiia bacterium]|nr:hypothetical protein [Acidimicrobiia bacterium]